MTMEEGGGRLVLQQKEPCTTMYSFALFHCIELSFSSCILEYWQVDLLAGWLEATRETITETVVVTVVETIDTIIDTAISTALSKAVSTAF